MAVSAGQGSEVQKSPGIEGPHLPPFRGEQRLSDGPMKGPIALDRLGKHHPVSLRSGDGHFAEAPGSISGRGQDNCSPSGDLGM